MPLTSVIAPHNAEGEHTLGLDHAGQQVNLLVLGMSIDNGGNGAENLFDGLAELRLVGMLLLNVLDYALDILVHWNHPP